MFDWTDEAIQTVKDLWGKQSANEIAGIIGHHSRNAVCGKAHRLGLAKISQPRSRSTPFLKPRVQRFREVMPIPIEITPGKATGQATLPERPGQVILMELTSDTCRFPLWTDANPEHLYCGAPGADMENKRPYCPVHSQMAYRRRGA